MFDYILFGVVDNVVMLSGAFYGLALEKHLGSKFQTGLGAILGAGLGNALSDFLGGMASLNYPLAFGTGFGCILALVLIPIFARSLNRGTK
tara:strand:- start:97 stop:369 length:273 start_codon:yes stop_codon:yes gene_type:complete